jgi:hypothetical protein
LRRTGALVDHPDVTRHRARDTGVGALLSLLVLATNVWVVSSHLGFLHKAKQVRETDQWRYIQMARDPERRNALAREATYCWRVFVPTTAGMLMRSGLSLNLSFWIITNVSLFGFLLVTWVYLRDLGLELPYRVAGLLTLGLTQGAVRWYEYQYWMTDPPSLFLIALALLLIRRRQQGWLHPTSVLAALVRENYMVVYPYYFLRLFRRGATLLEAARRTVALALLPLLILIGLRLLIVPDHPDSFRGDLVDTMGLRLRHLAEQPYLFTVGAYGVLVPLLLVFPRRIAGLARRHPEQAFLVAFFYALCIVANNTERELAYTLPAVLPAALLGLRDLVREAALPRLPTLVAVVALQGFFFSQQRFLDMGSSMSQPTNAAVVTAMLLFWLVAQASLARGRGRAGGGGGTDPTALGVGGPGPSP